MDALRKAREAVREKAASLGPCAYVSESGELTERCLSELKLNEAERELAREVVAAYWDAMKEAAVRDMVYDREASLENPDDVRIYRLPALGAAGRLERDDELQAALGPVIGRKGAALVVESLDDHPLMARRRKFDARIILSPSQTIRRPPGGVEVGRTVNARDAAATVTLYDPQSGEPIGALTTGSIEMMGRGEEFFGGIFLPGGPIDPFREDGMLDAE